MGFVTLASKRGGAPPGRYSTSSDSLACRCRRDGRTQPHETLTSTAATSLIRMRGLEWVRLGSRHSNRHAVVAHSAMCVQSFDDSLNSAIHITYRISLRSSSLREPRYPLLRVVSVRMLHKFLGLVRMVWLQLCLMFQVGCVLKQVRFACGSDVRY